MGRLREKFRRLLRPAALIAVLVSLVSFASGFNVVNDFFKNIYPLFFASKDDREPFLIFESFSYVRGNLIIVYSAFNPDSELASFSKIWFLCSEGDNKPVKFIANAAPISAMGFQSGEEPSVISLRRNEQLPSVAKSFFYPEEFLCQSVALSWLSGTNDRHQSEWVRLLPKTVAWSRPH